MRARISSSQLSSSIFKPLTKNPLENTFLRRHAKTGLTSPFLGFTKKIKELAPCSLGWEIRPMSNWRAIQLYGFCAAIVIVHGDLEDNCHGQLWRHQRCALSLGGYCVAKLLPPIEAFALRLPQQPQRPATWGAVNQMDHAPFPLEPK